VSAGHTRNAIGVSRGVPSCPLPPWGGGRKTRRPFAPALLAALLVALPSARGQERPSDFEVAVWYETARPAETLRSKVYDLRGPGAARRAPLARWIESFRHHGHAGWGGILVPVRLDGDAPAPTQVKAALERELESVRKLKPAGPGELAAPPVPPSESEESPDRVVAFWYPTDFPDQGRYRVYDARRGDLDREAIEAWRRRYAAGGVPGWSARVTPQRGKEAPGPTDAASEARERLRSGPAVAAAPVPRGALDLPLIWFTIVGVLLVGYAALDGFDLGVGMLHLFARDDTERRVFLNSIGPLWDGNEVWLVVFGGSMFAAFPDAYATAFSALYIPFMVLLFCLITRAVSIEFRSKTQNPFWRGLWDFGFCASSALATFLYGVAVGNTIIGLPIEPQTREYAGTALDLLTPYPLLVGVFAVAVFAMHGSIYLYLKTEGELQKRIHGWMWTTFGLFLTAYVLTTVVTLILVPKATQNFVRFPWLWLVVLLNVLAVVNIPRAIHLGRPMYAFLSSAGTIAALTCLFGAALYPNLVTSRAGPEQDLTIYNASSTDATLGLMLVMAILGMPFVLSYTAVVYWVFRGKVELGKLHY
jgi:cytochrome d ubiquinol oxidase subunit II